MPYRITFLEGSEVCEVWYLGSEGPAIKEFPMYTPSEKRWGEMFEAFIKETGKYTLSLHGSFIRKWSLIEEVD
jgi:hypothetical protein